MDTVATMEDAVMLESVTEAMEGMESAMELGMVAMEFTMAVAGVTVAMTVDMVVSRVAMELVTSGVMAVTEELKCFSHCRPWLTIAAT